MGQDEKKSKKRIAFATSPSNETDELEELIATRGKFVAQFVRLHFLVWF